MQCACRMVLAIEITSFSVSLRDELLYVRLVYSR